VQPVSETALSGASNVAAGQMARAADEAKDRLASARQDETGIGDKIGILQTEKSNLSDRLDMQNRQYKLLQAALQGKEKDLTSALSLSAANSKTLKDVRGELASLRRENDAQIKELQAQLKQKSAQYASLEQKLMLAEAKAKSAQDQETQDEADLAFIRQQLAQTQERLVAVEQEKNRMASQMASTAKDDKTAFQALKLQLSKARAQIAGLESKAAAEQVNISSAAAGTSQGSAPAANMTANPAATTPAMNAEPTPLVAAAPAAEPAAQAAPAKSGISSFFSSLFGHGYGGNNISSSEKSVSPAIVPPSQGENGLSPAPVLNASESGAASATDPMGDWKTVIVQ
ncbi:MAG: hypothetical protein KGQ70_02920, partial [Alphaproteobacteria bacterium]|nr:hypothetical protein [Alphaproteobacteria bacterium]